jgi:hypothetical protein
MEYWMLNGKDQCNARGGRCIRNVELARSQSGVGTTTGPLRARLPVATRSPVNGAAWQNGRDQFGRTRLRGPR